VFSLIKSPQTEAEREANRWMRRLNRERIRTPGPHEYVDECHWSKTGWAIWRKDGACTCHPARKPALKD